MSGQRPRLTNYSSLMSQLLNVVFFDLFLVWLGIKAALTLWYLFPITGLGGLQRSQIRMRANRGEWESAAEAFRNHVTAAGKVLPGLVKRREAEIALFLS